MTAEGPVTAVVVAAGRGVRLSGSLPKGLRPLGGRPMFLHSLEAFDRAPSVDRHVVVAPAGFLDAVLGAARGRLAKPLAVVAGGDRRQDSVLAGLEAARAESGPGAGGGGERLAAVHDAARPFVEPELIERIVAAARATGAAVPMVAVTDTVREIDAAGGPGRLLDRESLRLAQTPQTARLDWLIEAYSGAGARSRTLTDEGAALELAGRPFAVVEGAPSNLKITTPGELEMAEGILAKREGPVEVRIGYGEDRHPRDESRPFVLAGVTLDAHDGPSGHSDGDPLCHALVDALLGAAGAGNIGEMFPDTDARWRGAAGTDLLAGAVERLHRAGWCVLNADATLVMDAPRLAPFVAEIRARLAAALGIGGDRVSVKGKRAEGLGFEGSGAGVSCRAVVLIGGRGKP
jgi:2-C-methyl-D-erythritol 4-phosphate cytidylyltransferase/2-C-methyl-D-erythritol 2,4-cyclodiphosphate synthase